MAHHDDAATYADLLARLGDDGTRELFRRLLERAFQDLIDTELATPIGAGRHGRSETRSNWRNGGRTRTPCRPRRVISNCGFRRSGSATSFLPGWSPAGGSIRPCGR